MESLRNKIHVCLLERAPNALTFANLIGQIPGADTHTLEKELQSMSDDGLVVIRPGKRYPDYALTSYDGLPIREYVAVGDIKVPRLLSDERARPEELNIFVEVLARRMLQIELCSHTVRSIHRCLLPDRRLPEDSSAGGKLNLLVGVHPEFRTSPSFGDHAWSVYLAAESAVQVAASPQLTLPEGFPSQGEFNDSPLSLLLINTLLKAHASVVYSNAGRCYT